MYGISFPMSEAKQSKDLIITIGVVALVVEAVALVDEKWSSLLGYSLSALMMVAVLGLRVLQCSWNACFCCIRSICCWNWNHSMNVTCSCRTNIWQADSSFHWKRGELSASFVSTGQFYITPISNNYNSPLCTARIPIDLSCILHIISFDATYCWFLSLVAEYICTHQCRSWFDQLTLWE